MSHILTRKIINHLGISIIIITVIHITIIEISIVNITEIKIVKQIRQTKQIKQINKIKSYSREAIIPIMIVLIVLRISSSTILLNYHKNRIASSIINLTRNLNSEIYYLFKLKKRLSKVIPKTKDFKLSLLN
jgi:hypothetical protein